MNIITSVLNRVVFGLAPLIYPIGRLDNRIICWLKKATGWLETVNSVAAPAMANTSLSTNKILSNDNEVIALLLKQGYKETKNNAGGGKCLFYSIALQVTEQDIEEACRYYSGKDVFLSQLKQWKSLTKVEQADLLRVLAMNVETDLVKALSEKDGALNNQDQDFLNQFYRDCEQEISRPCSYPAILERVEKMTIGEKTEYCKKNFEKYKEITSGPTNWSGTTEAMSLAILFQRPLHIYGFDKIDCLTIQFNDKKEVLPYYQISFPNNMKNPLGIFQCWGGGHYIAIV